MTFIAGLALFGVACGDAPPDGRIEDSLDGLLARVRNVADRAANFDHDQALLEIGTDAANGTLNRLDDDLDSATFAWTGPLPRDLHSVAVTNGSDRGLIVREKTNGENEKLVAGETKVFRPNLDLDDFGALELELASAIGGRLTIELVGTGAEEVTTVDIDVAHDGRFRSYRVKFDETLRGWTGGRLRLLRLSFGADNGQGELEIKRAVALSPAAAFDSAPFGVTHHRQHGETRRSIYQWTPSVLRIPVTVESESESELEVGVAALLPGARGRVTITHSYDGSSHELFSGFIDAKDPWLDARLPLGALAEGLHEILLEVDSDEANVIMWSNPAVVNRITRRFNVIMVLEDALRADRLSCAGYPRLTTPVKDTFAKRGARFTNCYSQATKTRFSCPSFMTSLYPAATGVEGIWNLHPSLHDNFVTLAEVLRRRGFETASFHQNPNAGSPAGLEQGFSYLFESIGGRADALYDGMPMRWMESHRHRNFFAYMHVADPHEPYDPPNCFRTFFEEFQLTARTDLGAQLDRRDPLWMLGARRALYDGEVRNNDHWFEVFLQRLQQIGLAEDTLIVFMADHGEHLGEHGLWSHHPPGYVQVLHTPLILVYPRRIGTGLVIQENAQNLDIMPTILELAGIDTRGLLVLGRSLVPLFEGRDAGVFSRRAVYSEEALLKKMRNDPMPYGSVFVDDWHLIDSPYVPRRFFNLFNDPNEEDPRDLSRRLGRHYRGFLDEMQREELRIWHAVTNGEDQGVTLDLETISRLKALGYIE